LLGGGGRGRIALDQDDIGAGFGEGEGHGGADAPGPACDEGGLAGEGEEGEDGVGHGEVAREVGMEWSFSVGVVRASENDSGKVDIAGEQTQSICLLLGR